MSLIYFVLLFYRLNVPGPIKTQDPIQLDEHQNWPDWDTFTTLIAKDLERLNKGGIGRGGI